MDLVLALLDDAPARLGHRIPDAGEVAERLREHDPRLVRERAERAHLGVESPQLVEARAVEERPRIVLARVAERPELLAVRGRDGHLDRVLDAGAGARLLDEADH